jgi:hypothetical protein
VVDTDSVGAQIPTASFGKNARGLLLATTQAELEAAGGRAAPPKS